MNTAAQRPVGVFDSGVGGLTNVRALMERLPMESIVYFGDTARVPYGVKSRATIEAFTAQIVGFMLEHDVKALVIACNTIAAVAGHKVRQMAGNMPVLDVISAGAEAALAATRNNHIGVIATNTTVTAAMARQIKPIFTEVVAAPAFAEEALEILSAKKNLRLLVVSPPRREGYEIKQVSGGAVIQQRDSYQAGDADPSTWRLVAGRAADETTLADLRFAWEAVRSVRSNAILLAKGGATVGVGMGQVNRVDSCRLAVERANTLGARSTGDAAASDATAKGAVGGGDAADILQAAPPERARGAVAASDAFFPFADGLQVLIDAGVTAVVQPGGSIRDDEVIAAAQAAGVTMYLTGARHFAH